jgi:hypothetical protein
MDAETFAKHCGNDVIASWLQSTREWTVLHHLEQLTPERTIALLRAAADLDGVTSQTVLRPHREGECDTPLDLARKKTAAPAGSPAALVLLAAEPWSPATHHLFPLGTRLRATIFARIGFLLCRGNWPLFDVWRSHIIPLALDRSTPYDRARRTTRRTKGEKFLLEEPFVVRDSHPTFSYRTYTHGGTSGQGIVEVTAKM